jgi:Ca-activated chloride channel family protein
MGAMAKGYRTTMNTNTRYTTGKTGTQGWLIMLLALGLVWMTWLEGAEMAPMEVDRTEAPSFTVEGVDGGRVDAFPVKRTAVKAKVAGIIAEVEVVQVYANEAEVPLEAVYVFPGSTRAAVQGLEMRIGERVILAQIQEKAAAWAGYEKAKAEKKNTTLLEQARPNVFKMSVANIAPGAEVEVRLTYTEVLKPTERVYEFVFPTVVGPRYQRPGGKQEAWVGNPFLKEGTATPMAFEFEMSLNTGMAVQSLTCASHEAEVKFNHATAVEVKLKTGATADRDVVVRYQLADAKVATGLLLEKGAEENFFLLNVQPPVRVTPAQIPAREYVFIVDVSGSMDGFPIRTAQLLMAGLVGGLRAEDRFNVMTFASGSELMAERSVKADTEAVRQALSLVREKRGSGGTELLPALKRALALPREEGMARCVVLVTDGYISVEAEAFDLMRERLGEAAFFTFGIGSSVNRHLLEGLAHIGGGEPFVVLNESAARSEAKRFLQYVSAPVLTQVRVAFEGFATEEVQPMVVPDVYADRPVMVAGKWKGEARGRVKVSGLAAGRPYEAWIDVAGEAAKPGAMGNPALRSYWARERVRELGDYAGLGGREKNRTQAEVTALGLKYGLLTEYTSFLAVDERPQPELLAQTTVPVTQPLPIPHGVSQGAVGSSTVSITGNAGSTPEPGMMSLLMLSLAALWLQRRR